MLRLNGKSISLEVLSSVPIYVRHVLYCGHDIHVLPRSVKVFGDSGNFTNEPIEAFNIAWRVELGLKTYGLRKWDRTT